MTNKQQKSKPLRMGIISTDDDECGCVYKRISDLENSLGQPQA